MNIKDLNIMTHPYQIPPRHRNNTEFWENKKTGLERGLQTSVHSIQASEA